MIALDTGLGIAHTDKVVLVEVRSRTRREDEKLRFYEVPCRKRAESAALATSDLATHAQTRELGYEPST